VEFRYEASLEGLDQCGGEGAAAAAADSGAVETAAVEAAAAEAVGTTARSSSKAKGKGKKQPAPRRDWLCRLRDGSSVRGQVVVVATGGLSFPAVGTDGTGEALVEVLILVCLISWLWFAVCKLSFWIGVLVCSLEFEMVCRRLLHPSPSVGHPKSQPPSSLTPPRTHSRHPPPHTHTSTQPPGHRIIKQLGHSLSRPYAALTPLQGSHPGGEQLAGLSLPSVRLSAFNTAPAAATNIATNSSSTSTTSSASSSSGSPAGTTAATRGALKPKGKPIGTSPRGGFLFTHKGYSGPAVLDVSHHAVMSMDRREAQPPGESLQVLFMSCFVVGGSGRGGGGGRGCLSALSRCAQSMHLQTFPSVGRCHETLSHPWTPNRGLRSLITHTHPNPTPHTLNPHPTPQTQLYRTMQCCWSPGRATAQRSGTPACARGAPPWCPRCCSGAGCGSGSRRRCAARWGWWGGRRRRLVTRARAGCPCVDGCGCGSGLRRCLFQPHAASSRLCSLFIHQPTTRDPIPRQPTTRAPNNATHTS